MDWDRLRIFHTVAESGSFTNAGARLNCSQSAVSRQIRSLEESLNVSLFTRHARGLVLTQEGQELYNTAREVMLRIEETERSLMESRERPSGLLRVTTMVTFGAVWLTPHLEQFMSEYPDINIQLILDDADLDLSAGEADVAIRLHEPEQAELIQRPLATFHSHIYASPEYLDKRGTPITTDDLDAHDLITFGVSNVPTIRGLNWLLTVGNPRKNVSRACRSITFMVFFMRLKRAWASPCCPTIWCITARSWCVCCQRWKARPLTPSTVMRRNFVARSVWPCSAIS